MPKNKQKNTLREEMREIGFGNQARIVGAKRVELYNFIESKISEAYDKGYKEGVKDEIECVEVSGEHLDLQRKIKSKQLGQELIRELTSLKNNA